ncbi:MAG: 4-phosphoerythronate dehydrogenase PdxB [Bacteroides sp.]|nr:4-phosphoerythronate dehydrogenase PdxB [Bacteroides sp.]
MRVVVDDKIPYIKEAISRIADEVAYAPGGEFTHALIKDADALIVRTRTQCNRSLLEGSRVRFIATATIGYDHIDTKYCQEAGITWTNAPGCNADSVAQYIQSSLFLLQQKGCIPRNACIGIVGVGNVGSRVETVARDMGMKVLLNDPPRKEQEGSSGFVSLSQIAAACDIITFHTPLTPTGKYQTLHLADAGFFDSLLRQPVLINTSRGEVVSTTAMLAALKNGKVSEVVLDVWEGEPDLNPELLELSFLGTPHIAGYSADGKANATRMALDALCRYFDIRAEYTICPPEPQQPLICAPTWQEALLHIYNPQTDSQRLKQHPGDFEYLRGHYPLRREPKAYTIRIE